MGDRGEGPDSSVGGSANTEIATQPPSTSELRNLNTRLDEPTYLKFKDLAKRLGTKTNEEALKRLMTTQEKALAELDKLVVTQTVTFARPLFEALRTLQGKLAAKGFESKLSTIVNLVLLHFMLDTTSHALGNDTKATLRAYLRDGPKSVTRKMLQPFFTQELNLENNEGEEVGAVEHTVH
jgi:hypothetical protein